MYTKARIAGHPIHPMLVAFPIALYVATVVALFAHVGTHDPFWYRVALWSNIAAVVMAAVAAIPGLIDLVSLPSKSRARVTGIRHAAFNVLSLVLFAISAVLLYRNAGSTLTPVAESKYQLDVTAPLVLSIIGILSTLTAGWLGWNLVQTHHVGVHPTRFDRAGLRPEEIDDLDELESDRERHIPTTTYIETNRTTLRH